MGHGMSLFSFFRRSQPESSAQTAKERLQILLAHERQDRSGPDFLPRLQKDILEVIKKYVPGAGEKVRVNLQREADISTLEIEIELPGPRTPSAKRSGRPTAPAFAR
jgi:cell division topological specificity factor